MIIMIHYQDGDDVDVSMLKYLCFLLLPSMQQMKIKRIIGSIGPKGSKASKGYMDSASLCDKGLQGCSFIRVFFVSL